MAKGELKTKVTADISNFESNLKRAETLARSASARIGGALKSIGRVGAAGIGTGGALAGVGGLLAGGALARGVTEVYNMGGALSDLADQTGASIGNLVLLQKRFTDSGLAAEDAGGAINRMQKFLAEAEKDDGKRSQIESLGLSMEKLAAMKPEEQLEAIGKAINAIEKDTAKTAASMEIFGKAGAKLRSVFAGGPLLGGASDSVKTQAAFMEKYAASMDKLGDRLSGPNSPLKQFATGFGGAVAPAIERVVSRLEKYNLPAKGAEFGIYVMDAATALTRSVGQAVDGAKVIKGKLEGKAENVANTVNKAAGRTVIPSATSLIGGAAGRLGGDIMRGVRGDAWGTDETGSDGRVVVDGEPLYDYVSGRRPDWNSFYRNKKPSTIMSRQGSTLLGNDNPDGGAAARLRASWGWAPEDGKSSPGDALRGQFGWGAPGRASDDVRNRFGWPDFNNGSRKRNDQAAAQAAQAQQSDAATNSKIDELASRYEDAAARFEAAVMQTVAR